VRIKLALIKCVISNPSEGWNAEFAFLVVPKIGETIQVVFGGQSVGLGVEDVLHYGAGLMDEDGWDPRIVLTVYRRY
jgi:hypothetical protein